MVTHNVMQKTDFTVPPPRVFFFLFSHGDEKVVFLCFTETERFAFIQYGGTLISINGRGVVHVKIQNLFHLIDFIFLDTDLPEWNVRILCLVPLRADSLKSDKQISFYFIANNISLFSPIFFYAACSFLQHYVDFCSASLLSQFPYLSM